MNYLQKIQQYNEFLSTIFNKYQIPLREVEPSPDYALDPSSYRISKLGVPYLGWISLYSSSVPLYSNYEQIGFLNNEMIYLDECVFTVSQSFNIVETIVNGYKGTVKEFTAEGDFAISIKAKFIGDFYWNTDIDSIMKFQSIIQNFYIENVPLKLLNPELNLLYKIQDVVINSYTIEQDEESNNIRSLTLELKSDNDLPIMQAIN